MEKTYLGDGVYVEVERGRFFRIGGTGEQLTEREAWLAERASLIGASEAAAALGVDPFRSPTDLWLTKTGLAEPEDISGKLPVKIGLRLEHLIIEEFAEQSGRIVHPWTQYEIVHHPTVPYFGCTPDAEECNPDCLEERISLVQVKAVSAYQDKHWRDEPPLHYVVQCNAEMEVVDCPHSTLVALVGNSHLRWFDLERDDHFISVMLGKLAEFWRCVETRTPPAIDWSESCTRALEKLNPKDTGETIDLPPESSEWDAELSSIKMRIKDLEQERDLRENQIRAAMGPASYGVLPNGERWSWKWQERKGYEVKPSESRVLRRSKGNQAR